MPLPSSARRSLLEGSMSMSFLNIFCALDVMGLKLLGGLLVFLVRQAQKWAKLGSVTSARCQGRMPKRQKKTTMPNWKTSCTRSTCKDRKETGLLSVSQCGTLIYRDEKREKEAVFTQLSIRLLSHENFSLKLCNRTIE